MIGDVKLYVNDKGFLICECGHGNQKHTIRKSAGGHEDRICEVKNCKCKVGLTPTKQFIIRGIDCFADEYYDVGEYDTREQAEQALFEHEEDCKRHQDPEIRDHLWIEQNKRKV